ncbi:MAG TPA: hypothetical protein VL334_06270 [Anaerolineae bacterium]|nr:hypothetical protein [Anaerolineae bacterium]
MDTPTITIKLPAQLYTRLQTRARSERTDVIELLGRLIDTTENAPARQQATTQAFQRILERATDLGMSDLAEQHDHYLYGVDKR